MRALVEVRPGARALTREVARLANAVEALLAAAYGIRMQPTKPVRDGDDPEATYATDDSTFVQELKDVIEHRRPASVIGDGDD